MKVLVINTPIYNKIMENEKKKQNESNFKIKYEHNDKLDNLKGNYSLCTSEEIEKFVIDTNNLNNFNNEKSNNSEE